MEEKTVVLLSDFFSSPDGLSAKGEIEKKVFKERMKLKYSNINFDILCFNNYKCVYTAQAVSDLGKKSSYQVLTERFNPELAIEKIKNYEGNLVLVAPYLFIIEILNLLKYCKDEVYLGTREGVIIDSKGAFQLIKDLKNSKNTIWITKLN
jgi:hypothetical protein